MTLRGGAYGYQVNPFLKSSHWSLGYVATISKVYFPNTFTYWIHEHLWWICFQYPLLLTWFNFNPSMDK